MELNITCSAENCVDYKMIVPLQGNLKRRSDRDIEKLSRSIIEHGISFPFFIWRHEGAVYCIDGHGRLLAFAKLEKKGYIIPLVPIVEIFADTREQAVKILLYKNWKYGEMTYQSVMEFIGTTEMDMSDFQIPTGKMTYTGGITVDPSAFQITIPKYTPEIPTDSGGEPIPQIPTFRLGKTILPLTPEEANLLTNELNLYARENNGLFGFVNYLLGE